MGIISERTSQNQSGKYIDLKKRFIEIYGGSADDLRTFAAPGRVNLIGEHIDYCGGYVFPAAISLDTTIIARARTDRLINLAATDLPDRISMQLDQLEKGKALRWGNYQLGVANEMQLSGFQLTGVDLLYHDTVPLGAGLSSSAAIQLATAITLATLGNEHAGIGKPIDLVQLAIICQQAEHNYVGVQCGIMDQITSAIGKKDHAILLDCKTLAYEYVPLTLGIYCLVLANTKKKRSLGESKYNERVAETQAGLEIMQKFLPGRLSLCEINVWEFEQYKDQIDPVIRKRVEHVVKENARVKTACQALKANDLPAFADLLNQAQVSIHELYEVTGFELDTMVSEARKADGCIAARMTGAGFGGCTVNLVHKDSIKTFIQKTGENYQAKTGIVPEFYVCEIGDGAREIILNK